MKTIDDVSYAAVLLAISKAKRWQLALTLTSLRSSRCPKFIGVFVGALDHFLLTVKSDKQVDPWLLMCVFVFCFKGVLYYSYSILC